MDKYICVPYIHIQESTRKNLPTQLKKWKWSSWKTRHVYTTFFNDEENGYCLEPQRKETVYTHIVWLIAVRERLLEFYSALNYLIQQNALALDVIQVLIVGAIFNLAKVSTIHCMFTATLSL